MAMAFFLMRDVGVSKFSARLATNLWANRALQVSIETSGIKIAQDGDLIPVNPIVPAKYPAAAWHEFCREVGFDARAVWFSDVREYYVEGRRKEFFFSAFAGSAGLDIRGHAAISRDTGTAVHIHYSILVAGSLKFTIRYPESSRESVDAFVRACGSWIRFGKRRSVHGSFGVEETHPVPVDVAKAFEAFSLEPVSAPEVKKPEPIGEWAIFYDLTHKEEEPPDLDLVASRIVRFYDLDKVAPQDVWSHVVNVAGCRSPFEAFFALRVQALKENSLWARLPRVGGKQVLGGLERRLGARVGEFIKELPDHETMCQFLNKVLAQAGALKLT